MLLGDVLVAQGLVSPADIEVALERQRTQGGILGEHLIAMGKLDPADLQRVMGSAPPSPRNIEETGLSVNDLLNLVAKAMYNGAEMPSQIGGVLKLPQRVVQLVLEQAKERKMLDVLDRPAPTPPRSSATHYRRRGGNGRSTQSPRTSISAPRR